MSTATDYNHEYSRLALKKWQIRAVNVLIIRSRLSPSLATLRHILVIQSIQFQPVQRAGGRRGGGVQLFPRPLNVSHD